MWSQKQKDMKLYVFDGLKRALSECESYATNYSICSDEQKVTDMISEIVNELNIRQKDLKESSKNLDFNQENWQSQQPLLAIIIDEANEFMKTINEGNFKKIRIISKNAEGLGVVIFIAGRVGDLEQLNDSNPIVHDWIASQKGLVFSGTVGAHSFFENGLSYQEKGYALKEGEAYLVNKGELIKIKPAG